jgi:hypothetical protein
VRLDKIAGGSAKLDASFRAALFNQGRQCLVLAGDGARGGAKLLRRAGAFGGDPDLFADLAVAQAMRRIGRKWCWTSSRLQLSPRRPICWCCVPAPGVR